MTITDPPGYSNTGLYKLKYENFERNSEIQNFQSHKNESCVPTNLINIHRGNCSRDTTTTVSTLTPNKSIHVTNNSSCDTTTTVSTLIPNKSIDTTNNSCDTTTTDPTHPTNKSNDNTTTTVPKFQSPDKRITTTTVPITTTTITIPNNDTQSKAQRPATNGNLVTTPSLDPRLLVNTILTKQLFIDIIREYSSNEPPNATTKLILSNFLQQRIQYKTKQSRLFYPINSNNLTPINFNNDSLVTLYNREL